jgi:hypothetical protein
VLVAKVARYVPAGQSTHGWASALSVILPGAQAKQLEEPATDVKPGSQVRHTASLAPAAAAYFPTEQSVHSVELTVAYCPGAHAWQSLMDEPVPSRLVAAGHAVHDVERSGA